MKKSGIVISALVFIIFILLFCFIYFYGVLVFNKNHDSDWDVSIIDVQIKGHVGDVLSDSTPIFDKTTVTFKNDFTSPGDSITYDITIKNNGNTNAKLKKIIISDNSNDDIDAELSGVTEGQVLKAGELCFVHVTIGYSENSEKISESIQSSLTIKLDYASV